MVEAQPFGISPVVGATVGNLASFTAVGLGDSGVSSAVAHDPAMLYVAANGNDATAARGRSDLPFATLNAAAGAAVSGDTVRVGVGTFAPLAATLPAWVRIIGAGRPHVDSVTAPTTLLGGTVIQGPLLGTNDGFELWHAGVDSGTAACTALYGGTAQDALAISNVPGSHPTGLPQLKGVRVCDVACLAQAPTASVHACRIENVYAAIVSGIETWFGVHGLAFKGVDSNISNHIASGHGSTGLYLKSDNYAPCNNVNATNIVARPAGSSGVASTGIVIGGATASISSIALTNFNVEPGLQHGLQLDATAGMEDVSIANGTIGGTSGDGVSFTSTGCDRVTLANVHVANAAGNGFTVTGSCFRTSLTACLAFNCGGDGFNLVSGGPPNGVLSLFGCAAYQNAGNGFNSLGPAAGTFGAGLVSVANTTASFAGNAILAPAGPILGGALVSQAGSAGAWVIGPDAGSGSGDDTYGIYSATYGPTHSYYPIMQLGSDGSAAFCRGGGAFLLPSLPTSDPHVAGQCWSNAGIVTVSAG